MGKLSTAHGRISYRVKRSHRLAMLASALAMWLLMLGLLLTSLFVFRPAIADVEGLLGEEVNSYATLITLGSIALPILMTAVVIYVARYWWTYRVVLDRDSVAREGTWHILDRRSRIPYAEVERVTHGTRNVIRVIPQDGRVLAVNVGILEGAVPDLIDELRSRVGPDKLPIDLETSVFEKTRRDRLEMALVWVTIGVFVVYMTTFLLQDRILALYAWTDVVPGNRKVVAFDVGEGGDIWALSEGRLERRELGLRLTRVVGTDRESYDLPLSGLAREVAHPYDPVYNSIEGVAIDSRDRLWVLFEETRVLHYWDEQRWRQLNVGAPDEEFFPRGIARVGSEIWAITRGAAGVVRIDAESLDGFAFSIQGRESGQDQTVTLAPRSMVRGNDGGVVITGSLNLGYPGVAAFDGSGEITLFIGMDETTPVPDDSWRLGFAGTDRDSNLYVVYWSERGCTDSALRFVVGVWEHGAGEWKWGELNRPLNCSEYWSHPSFAVDALGRIWVQFYSSERQAEVLVYERSQWGEIGGESGASIRTYSEGNSHYIGEDLQTSSSGLIYSIADYGGKATWIDASANNLPTPAPAIFSFLWDRSYLVFLPFVAAGVLLSVVNIRRNAGRD